MTTSDKVAEKYSELMRLRGYEMHTIDVQPFTEGVFRVEAWAEGIPGSELGFVTEQDIDEIIDLLTPTGS